MSNEYKSGLYRYNAGAGKAQSVILHIDGYWYLAGWEIPLGMNYSGESGFGSVMTCDIGEQICEIKDE